MNKQQPNTFPFASILTLIFITLKLTGHIAWSWWWVLSPLWITLALAIVIGLIVGLVMALREERSYRRS